MRLPYWGGLDIFENRETLPMAFLRKGYQSEKLSLLDKQYLSQDNSADTFLSLA